MIFHMVSAANCLKAESWQDNFLQDSKLASMQLLVAKFTHRINNPINNLSLTMEALLEDGESMEDAERRKLYLDAVEQVDRVAEDVRILQVLLGKPSGADDVDTVEIVDEAATLVKSEMDLRDICFTRTVRTKSRMVHMDRGDLRLVLLNLFAISIQAEDRGRGKLNVVIGPASSPGEIRIDVIYNGSRIPPVNPDQIFDPGCTGRNEAPGAGVALPISCRIIKENGGRIQVENRPDRFEPGACYSIFLPLAGSSC